MSGPLALLVADPDGGYDVVDTRDGQPLAWGGEVSSANAIAASLNAHYPAGTPAPAHDSLVHEICMERIGGAVAPLDRWAAEPGNVLGHVPAAVVAGPALWKPGGGR